MLDKCEMVGRKVYDVVSDVGYKHGVFYTSHLYIAHLTAHLPHGTSYILNGSYEKALIVHHRYVRLMDYRYIHIITIAEC